ncbi:RNA pseudouridine synthase [Shewanella inventionis]|uniref:RNA pseudouridine synthase n=1 Tax=Shewanella inventionis TaxID=1738770 RepID=A0ABQ1JR67_9GAMM|nr:RluA family pseudouridine synthase [Shewanella inventionis]MCL1159978.1 pseudouridine synthase [Shewanella inventionis]UAL44581.1 RNA pseudouridine synthase [Shewanella inventionis]GGB74755.1 RNA pseudouridine synthase [Shewanella inventionis]
MTVNDPCFIFFNDSIAHHSLPESFTFPFYYQPHPICIQAAEQLQQTMLEVNPWQHNFGLDSSTDCGMVIGKMFGVLVVKNTQGQLGFLAAFSGKLAEQNILPPFVPPVFDMLTQDSFFSVENKQINQINQLLHQHESAPLLANLTTQLTQQQQQAERELEQQRNAIVEGRKQRKQQREQADTALIQADISSDEHKTLSIELSRQSVLQKHQLNALKQQWQSQITATQTQLNELQQQIKQLKRQRKQLSNSLQKKLFAQYQFLNTLGDARDLNDIFNDAPNHLPPAGAGECAAPKLLQYAFKQQLTPVAMAEFWWGASPKSEIKQHQNYYPACHGKCRPILAHMLTGMQVDADPLLINPGKDLPIDIIYQDEVMAIINKPAELLSVPGKNIIDSVFSRMQQQFPNATGPLIVHRLDMSTSGLMVIALTKEANKNLQQQFIQRSVTKRYIALIEGVPDQNEGDISLPLRVDLDDRPKQLVCYEHGKHAQTHWQIFKRQGHRTLVHLYPKTGRTHQLRMHCAHHDGLNMPIVGDDLYGIAANRLHLHAQYLALTHPESGEAMVFEVKADFE